MASFEGEVEVSIGSDEITAAIDEAIKEGRINNALGNIHAFLGEFEAEHLLKVPDPMRLNISKALRKLADRFDPQLRDADGDGV